jgi:hypothetical protein
VLLGGWTDYKPEYFYGMSGGKDELGKPFIWIPKTDSDAVAAFVLVHEAAHIRQLGKGLSTKEDEYRAYLRETEWLIENPELIGEFVRANLELFLNETEKGKYTPNKTAILQKAEFAERNYYNPSPNRQYKKSKGEIVIELGGSELIMGGWDSAPAPVP